MVACYRIERNNRLNSYRIAHRNYYLFCSGHFGIMLRYSYSSDHSEPASGSEHYSFLINDLFRQLGIAYGKRSQQLYLVARHRIERYYRCYCFCQPNGNYHLYCHRNLGYGMHKYIHYYHNC
jgi:hypothetical protein